MTCLNISYFQVVIQENNLGTGREECSEPNASQVSYYVQLGGAEGVRRQSFFRKPIDWLKIYQILVGFFLLFPSIFLLRLYSFFQGTEKLLIQHYRTSNRNCN